MEPTLKQSSSFGRSSFLDVGQLDKVNAIRNKTDNILTADLCPEDQLYLNGLMEIDSSDQDDDEGASRRSSSIWSPMVQSPVMMTNSNGKRIKRLRPSYAITLSLEDISYIRPSWGISKGIRTIELNRKKKKEPAKSEVIDEEKKSCEKSTSSSEMALQYSLVLLTIVVVLLTVPTYMAEKRRLESRILTNKINVNIGSRLLEIYRPGIDGLESILEVQLGQGIPRNLKPDECTCSVYTGETRKYDRENLLDDKKECVSCLDWAYRANLRIYMDRRYDGKDPYCYDIKWQSYDTLQTPLVDCFNLGDEQWLGLGDIQTPIWPLNKLQFDWTALATNLTTDFLTDHQLIEDSTLNHLALGTYADFAFLSTNGISIGNIKTDFAVSLKISQDPGLDSKHLCLSVACKDKCTQSWSRADHWNRLKYQNNILEYRICSAESIKTLISSQVIERARTVVENARKFNTSDGLTLSSAKSSNLPIMSEKLIERESRSDGSSTGIAGTKLDLSEPRVANDSVTEREPPETIGLIERTIFATSQEFMPTLDGQSLRLHVDNIVKLGLKTSAILLIDSRWETYVGSLKLNTARFPKSKLLFEILHNKGFKIVFSIKPYIDTSIGVGNINQLFEADRLYTVNYRKDTIDALNGLSSDRSSSRSRIPQPGITVDSIVRRRSLFTYENQSIYIGSNVTHGFPYLFPCKESQEGHCALLDLTQAVNRNWFINNIKRSNLLTQEADGIQIGGTHPNNYHWDDHYRSGVSELVRSLVYKDKRLYTLPQWTGDFGYIQLAPRHCNWNGLRSIVNSVLNLGVLGFSMVHTGSVWGDLKSPNSTQPEVFKSPKRMEGFYGNAQPEEKSNEELMIRWLQVSTFMPILQFNNLAPIERHGLQELVQTLVRIRKVHIVPEMTKYLPLKPVIGQSRRFNLTNQLPLVRPVWYSQESGETVVAEQFAIGPDILVAPILNEGARQRDIYLPGGFWHDELRRANIRGGKWLRNYPVELNEVAWFTRAKR